MYIKKNIFRVDFIKTGEALFFDKYFCYYNIFQIIFILLYVII